MKAHKILKQGNAEMKDRAKTYDAPEGERSMGKAIAMFNELKGTDLSEFDGWQFMEILKMVRGNQGDFKLDNFVDGAAYAALAGEAAANDAEKPKTNWENVTSMFGHQITVCTNVHQMPAIKDAVGKVVKLHVNQFGDAELVIEF